MSNFDESESGGVENQRPSRKDCQKAIKILTQYERLANKYNITLPPRRLAELNRLRDEGLIALNNLPATFRAEFPIGIFDNLTLAEIRQLCEM